MSPRFRFVLASFQCLFFPKNTPWIRAIETVSPPGFPPIVPKKWRRLPVWIAVLGFLVSSSTLSAQCITVDAGPDVVLCVPASPTHLNGSISGSYLGFTWTPTTGLQGATTLSPTVNVTQNTTYTLTASAVDLTTNSIVNGDFESGNTGFTSDYAYSPGDLNPEGLYDVTNDPHNDHNNFAHCPDHTGGGNMMVVNGAGTPNQDVWCQSVPIMANTEYVFSCWVSTVVTSSPALLQFSINGASLGPIFQAPTQNCVWQNFYFTWNSGANTSATICVVNQNTQLGGNDFALDDIVFTPVCVQSDDVEVTVVNLTAVATANTPIPACGDPAITLNGYGSSTGAGISYEWTTPNGNILSDETTLYPIVNTPGTYTLYVSYDNNGMTCSKTATVVVTQAPNSLIASINPAPPLGCGTSSMTLFGNSNATGAVDYQWTALTGNIVGFSDQQNIVINQPGQYELLVTDAVNGCTSTASVTIAGATSPPIATATANGPLTCTQTTATLSGAGSSTGAGITYQWTAAGGGTVTSGQNSQNAVAGSAGTYMLLVTNTISGCSATATVVLTGTAVPPTLSIQPPGALDCDTPTLPLSATVTPANAVLSWTTTGGGQIVSGQNTTNPVISAAGTYTLLVTNPVNGCTATASTSVVSNTTPSIAIATSPSNLTCQNPSVTLSGTGSSAGANFTYVWSSSPGGNIVSGGTTLNPTVNVASTYTLLVTNTITACTATASVTVLSDQNVLTAIANAPDTLTCTVNMVTLNSTGTSTGPTLFYNWTTTNGNISGPTNVPSPIATLPGTYQLLVTNPANGCTATDLAEVVQNHTPPMLQTSVSGMLNCANPTLSLQGQNLSLPGNFSYQWTASSGGNIVSGATGLMPIVNAAGQYMLTATNIATGCTGQSTVAVTAQAGTPTAIIAAPGPLTCVTTNQTLNTSGSSSGANFTYTWTTSNGGNIVSGGNSPSPIVNTAGTYNLLISNTANGCSATTSVVLTGNTTVPPAEAGAPGLITCSQPSFSLVANPGLPAGNLVFQWTTSSGQFVGNPNAAQVSANQAGLYHLLVTNPANGCKAVDSVQVTANQQLPTVTIAPPTPLDCSHATTTLSATATGTTLTYQWQTTGGQFVSGATSASPVVNAAGLYSLTVTNSTNGCTRTASATVTANGAPPNVQAAPVAPITCIALTQTISAQNLSLPGNFTYQWTAANGGNIVSGATTLTPTVNAGGNYTLTTTNVTSGCSNVLVVNVTQSAIPPTANAGPDLTLSCTANSLIINGSGTGSNNLIYAWTASNGGNLVSGTATATPTINQPGTYTLLVTNPTSGCTATDLVQIMANQQLPTITIASPALLTCLQTTATLSATATGNTLTYQWQTSGGSLVSGATSATPVVDAPGTYSVTVTDGSNSCTRTATVTVLENVVLPDVQAAPVAPITCTALTQIISGQNLSAPGNFTYNWTTTTTGNIVSGNNTLTPTVDAGGDYTLITTDETNGCTSTLQISVAQNTTLPTANAGPNDTLTCINNSLTINGSGAGASNLNYSWTTTNGGNLVSGANTATPIVDHSGTYTLLVTNPTNGCTASDLVQIRANQQLPTITIAPPTSLTCTQMTATLSTTATGNVLTYEWQTVGGQFVSGATSATPTVDAAGTYNVTVTDGQNGCSTIATMSVLENTTPPNVQATPVQAITCIAPTQIITAQNLSLPGNFSYAWTATNGGNIFSGNTSLTPTVNAGGDYTLTATNGSNGCTSILPVTVAQNTALPTANAGTDNTLSCGVNALTINGSGTGANNLTYVWTASNGGHIVNGTNTATLNIDQPGDYTLLVTNPANGCTASDAVQILNDNNAPQVNAGPSPILTCTLQQTTLNATASTGATLSYQWTTTGGSLVSGATTLSPTIDAPGLYQLAVTNSANGCVSIDTVNVGENVMLPSVDAGLPDTLTCMTLALPLSGMASGANNLIFQWTTTNGNIVSGANTLTPQVNRMGVYELTTTNPANGCTNTDIVSVAIDTLHFGVVASVPGPLTCQMLTIGITGAVNLPGAFTAAWTTTTGHFNGPQNMLGAVVSAPGLYQLTVQSTANGCTSTAQVTVLQDIAPPLVQANAPGQITCDHPTIALSGTGSSSGTGFNYVWTASNGGQIQSGQTTLTPTVTAAGIYSLQVTNSTNGCKATDTTAVTANITPPTVVILLPQVLTCTHLSAVLNASGSSGGANFTNTWTSSPAGHFVSGQTTLMPTVDQAGAYLLTIHNTENGCLAMAQTSVTKNIVPPVANAGPDAELYCQQTEVTLQGSGTAVSPLTFAWLTPDGHLQSGNNTANPVADQAGIYNLTVTNTENGCTATDAALITQIPLPDFVATLWQPDCFDRTGNVDFGPVTGGKPPFRYSADGGLTFRTSPTFDDLAVGSHDLVVEDQNGCTATQSVEVQMPFLPTVTLANLFTIEQGDSVRLEPVLNLAAQQHRHLGMDTHGASLLHGLPQTLGKTSF